MVMRFTARQLGGLLCLLLFSSLTWADNNNAHQLLKKMSEAGQNLSYRGSFTYEHGSSIESFRVVRWTDEGVNYERLEHLSGPERQFIRPVRPKGCTPFGGALLQDRLSRLGSDGAEIDRYYRLVAYERERVAGRHAQVIQIIPRDQMRYGYVVSLDQATGMLLKTLLLDEQQRVVERFQFIEFDAAPQAEIGRASCRERGWSWEGAVSLKV